MTQKSAVDLLLLAAQITHQSYLLSFFQVKAAVTPTDAESLPYKPEHSFHLRFFALMFDGRNRHKHPGINFWTWLRFLAIFSSSSQFLIRQLRVTHNFSVPWSLSNPLSCVSVHEDVAADVHSACKCFIQSEPKEDLVKSTYTPPLSISQHVDVSMVSIIPVLMYCNILPPSSALLQ